MKKRTAAPPAPGGADRPPPPQGGRPSKLTPELTAKVTAAVRAGNWLETAAAYAGVHRATLHEWLKRGRAELDRLAEEELNPPVEPQRRTRKWLAAREARQLEREAEAPYAAFAGAVEQALADAEVASVTRITAAASKGDWKADAWRLEKMNPQRYGRASTHTHQGPNGGPVPHRVEPAAATQVDLSRLDDAELEQLEALLRKGAAAANAGGDDGEGDGGAAAANA